jgi:hypothetical protein
VSGQRSVIDYEHEPDVVQMGRELRVLELFEVLNPWMELCQSSTRWDRRRRPRQSVPSGKCSSRARAMYAPRCARLARDGWRVLRVGREMWGNIFKRNDLSAGWRKNRHAVISGRS